MLKKYQAEDTCPGHLDTSSVGDGRCDDDLNQAACAYDGGDCCLAQVNTQICEKCQCIECN